MTDNTIVNGLWVGNRLSPLELLTLHSFVDYGHVFHLWIYEELENQLPQNVILKDANEIVPKTDIFRLKYGDVEEGFGVGSLALFADWFRYNLLYQQGGWWVDMDVTCLSPLDISTEYYFRNHFVLPMIGNVMKCPPKAPFLLETIKQLSPESIENTKDWLYPNKVLNEQIKIFNLSNFIRKGNSNIDNWIEIEPLLYQQNALNPSWKYLHWMNEEWRTQQIDKIAFYQSTTLSYLMQKHGVPFQTKSKRKSYYYWHFKKSKLGQGIKSIIKPN